MSIEDYVDFDYFAEDTDLDEERLAENRAARAPRAPRTSPTTQPPLFDCTSVSPDPAVLRSVICGASESRLVLTSAKTGAVVMLAIRPLPARDHDRDTAHVVLELPGDSAAVHTALTATPRGARLGMVFGAHRYMPGAALKWTDAVATSALAAVAWEYFWGRLQGGFGMPPSLSVQIARRCINPRCKRWLTQASSVARGLGDTCARRYDNDAGDAG